MAALLDVRRIVEQHRQPDAPVLELREAGRAGIGGSKLEALARGPTQTLSAHVLRAIEGGPVDRSHGHAELSQYACVGVARVDRPKEGNRYAIPQESIRLNVR